MAKRFYLNNNWLFTEKFSEDLLDKEKPAPGLVTVSIPHSVKETPFNYFDESQYQMVAGYQKIIKLPLDWKDKILRLTFEGVAHEATVYINGKERARHSCGYTAFTVDITNDYTPGGILAIAVKVDSRETINQPPFGFVIDYMTYGGIYRDVYIDVSERTYLQDLFLYSDFALTKTFLCSECRIYNPDKKPLILEQSCNGETFSKEIILPSGLDSQVSEFRFSPSNVKNWDIENPVLYTVETKLYDTGKNLLDERTDKFGFRNIEFKADGFYLNNKKIKIRGLNRHQSFPYVGYAMPDSMQIQDADILKKELCVNAVRTSHYPQSHAFINRCDELGLLVFMEIPGWQHIGDECWRHQAVENVKEMVKQYRNHPSIILWGVRINESEDDDVLYTKTNDIAHKLDKTRPTGGVRAIKKSSLLEDVYTYNDFVHDGRAKGCEPKKKVTSDMTKAYLVSEYNGHMYPTKAFDWEEHRREHMLRHANVLEAIAKEEDIAGSFGWCMFDYNTHKDFGSGDRICYHGVMDMFRNPKLAAGAYSCEGNTEGVYLEVSSTMDIGEHPGSNRGATYILSNADSVRMYKNDRFLKEYFPKDSEYEHLSHGPIRINDFIGDAIDEGEEYSLKLKAEIKEMLNATALYGMNRLPKRVILLAAKAMLVHHMTFLDAYRLYNKYIGDWGGEATVYKFEAIKDGKVAKTLIKAPTKEIHLKTTESHTDLKTGKTYDVAEVRIKAVDDYGNVVPFFNEPVNFKTAGAVKIIGPSSISLKGGMAGVYVRTVDSLELPCEGSLFIENYQCGEIEIKFNVAKEKIKEL